MEYKSLDRHEIKGRGTLYSVVNEKDRQRSSNDLVGAVVWLDGKKVKVKGVEYYALKKIPKGAIMGLLV